MYVENKSQPILSYDEQADLKEWRKMLWGKLAELLGEVECFADTDVNIEWRKDRDGYTETRFTFASAEDSRVPCHLLVPHNVPLPCPVIICLQGHSKGMHISLGQPLFEGDAESIAGGRDFALQAVNQGYAALTIEQMAMGERSGRKDYNPACHIPSARELLYGRTMIGRRVFDVKRAIDVLADFPEIDTEKIACMGNSGGGTTTFYAACLDDRIKIAMPSCSFCTYEKSIEWINHCICNFIPGSKKYFDTGDLTALIAPRTLIIVAGQHDEIFPIDGVQEAFAQAERIYKTFGCEDKLSLVIGNEGHRFYPEQGFSVFNKLSGWKNI